MASGGSRTGAGRPKKVQEVVNTPEPEKKPLESDPERSENYEDIKEKNKQQKEKSKKFDDVKNQNIKAEASPSEGNFFNKLWDTLIGF